MKCSVHKSTPWIFIGPSCRRPSVSIRRYAAGRCNIAALTWAAIGSSSKAKLRNLFHMNNHDKEASYRLAALDQDFILGDSMRGARFMMEYAKAEEHLRRMRVRSTIVVFGSARIREDGNAWQSRIY